MEQMADDLIARLIHEALEQLGWQKDATTLADLVRRLNIGLPAEDEFSVILSWLGNCRLVHKLDQMQTPPDSKNIYQVPDLLAVFEYQNKLIPVLIEVKSKQSQTLSWRSDYYESLQRYGQILTLPVLVAWKFHGLWSLFELTHFKKAIKNYNIKLEMAMRESLMGILAGDFAYSMQKGVGFHLSFTKDKLIEELQQEDGNVLQKWIMTLENIYFTDGEQNQVKHLLPGFWPLFLAYNHEEITDTTETRITQSFVVTSDSTFEFAHTGLVKLLDFFTPGGEGIKWRDVLRKHDVQTSRAQFRKSAEEGIDSNFVQMVLDQIPQTRPSFLL